jgi:hypothetical protein
MTAATADINRRSKLNSVGGIRQFPIATNTRIFKGTLVALNAAGYAIPATDTTGLFIVGVAEESVNNNPGANAARTIQVSYDREYSFTHDGTLSQASVGQMATVLDDSTISIAATTTNDIPVGTIREYVSATEAFVYIRGTRSPA